MKSPESVDARFSRLARATASLAPPAGIEARILDALRSRAMQPWVALWSSSRRALAAAGFVSAAAVGIAAYAEFHSSAYAEEQVTLAIGETERNVGLELPDEL